MVDFSRDELLKLAALSSLQLDEEEIKELEVELKVTLEYIQQLDKFEAKPEHDAVKTINVFREDKATPKDASALLVQAPETKETYFVVPKILERS